MKQFVAAFVVVLSAEQAFGWWNASCPCESPPALFSETGTVTTVASEIAAGEVGETAAKNLDNISNYQLGAVDFRMTLQR